MTVAPPRSDPRCPACGEPIEYCSGHGPVGDPAGYAILLRHDRDEHDRCHPVGCDAWGGIPVLVFGVSDNGEPIPGRMLPDDSIYLNRNAKVTPAYGRAFLAPEPHEQETRS